jgi:hypothetical protein
MPDNDYCKKCKGTGLRTVSKIFHVGNKVKITKKFAKYILSNEGQDNFFPSSGILDPYQENVHTLNTLMALNTLMGEKIVGEVEAIHYPRTREENYQVAFIVDSRYFTSNIQAEDLVKQRSK